MATERRARASMSAASGGLLAVLDENALAQVLLAARDANTLGLLASSSRQLCRFARSRVPVRLEVDCEVYAGYIIKSRTCGRPPFSSCTELLIEAPEPVQCCLAMGVLRAAQQWTALQQLELHLLQRAKVAPADTLECCLSTVLGSVPALQHLQRLDLEAPAIGASCGVHLLQLRQLTSLRLIAGASPPAAAAADLGALSAMTNLVELDLNWALAPHLPAGPEGPYCLPSSLVTLSLSSQGHNSPAPMACWVAQLPGCPQLQHLMLQYGEGPHHHSTHPSAVTAVLAEHHPRLCSLQTPNVPVATVFTAHVPELPDAADEVARQWQPSAALAALKRLERLGGGGLLVIRDLADWQHLVQLTALKELAAACVCCVPQLAPGATLVLLELWQCRVELGGRDMGLLLLACPGLKTVRVRVASAPAVVPAEAPRLLPHAALEDFHLEGCNMWGRVPAAAAQWAALAPVLSSVSRLHISQWPIPSSTFEAALPDLSPCTALTRLEFRCVKRSRPLGRALPEQEAFLSMLAPLKRLQHLDIHWAPQLNARIVLVLQSMLPQLCNVSLCNCGRLVPEALQGEDPDEEEEEAQTGVEGLLRRGLELLVEGYCNWP